VLSLEQEGSLFGDTLEVVNAGTGKEAICKKLDALMNDIRVDKVLLLFDRVSFGVCFTEYKNLLQLCVSRIFIVSDYQSWEYLMLRSNMFRDQFIDYSLGCGMFKEKYYEELLEEVSRGTYSTIRHDKSKLSECYTERCCYFAGGNSERDCKIGLSGGDKHVAMLIGTEFSGLLSVARRV
jgi:hypothetical protein